MPTAPRKSETRALSRQGLTETEKEFIKHYTNPKSPTYRNGTRSMLATKPHKNQHSAQVCASQMIRRKQVNKALKDILDRPSYKETIRRRLEELLEDPSIRPRDLLGAMDFWSKITGAYSPEKHMNLNLTPEDRDAKYQDILSKVRGEQAKLPTTPPPPPMKVLNPTPPEVETPVGSQVVEPTDDVFEEDLEEDEDEEFEV